MTANVVACGRSRLAFHIGTLINEPSADHVLCHGFVRLHRYHVVVLKYGVDSLLCWLGQTEEV